MKIEIELKPCPFCGNTNLFVGTSAQLHGDDDEDDYAVCCDFEQGGCGATGGYQLSKIKAIELWNKRV